MSAFFALAFCASLLVAVGGLIVGLFFKGRRAKGWLAVLAAFVTSIATGIGLTTEMDNDARNAGFEDYSDQATAKRAGVTDPEDWEGLRSDFEAAEAEKRRVEREFEAAEADKRRVEREAAAAAKVAAAPPSEEEVCMSDLVCWGDKQLVWAGYKCPPEIEKLAAYRAVWNDSWMEFKFSGYRWLSKESGTLTMIGDKVEFENGFGSGINMIYECDIDPDSEVVLAVRVQEGRL